MFLYIDLYNPHFIMSNLDYSRVEIAADARRGP